MTVGKETHLLELPENLQGNIPDNYELRSSKKVSEAFLRFFLCTYVSQIPCTSILLSEPCCDYVFIPSMKRNISFPSVIMFLPLTLAILIVFFLQHKIINNWIGFYLDPINLQRVMSVSVTMAMRSLLYS